MPAAHSRHLARSRSAARQPVTTPPGEARRLSAGPTTAARRRCTGGQAPEPSAPALSYSNYTARQCRKITDLACHHGQRVAHQTQQDRAAAIAAELTATAARPAPCPAASPSGACAAAGPAAAATPTPPSCTARTGSGPARRPARPSPGWLPDDQVERLPAHGWTTTAGSANWSPSSSPSASRSPNRPPLEPRARHGRQHPEEPRLNTVVRRPLNPWTASPISPRSAQVKPKREGLTLSSTLSSTPLAPPFFVCLFDKIDPNYWVLIFA